MRAISRRNVHLLHELDEYDANRRTGPRKRELTPAAAASRCASDDRVSTNREARTAVAQRPNTLASRSVEPAGRVARRQPVLVTATMVALRNLMTTNAVMNTLRAHI